jgi:protein TonB
VSAPYEGEDAGSVGDVSTGGTWTGGSVRPEEETTEPSVFTPYEKPPEVVKRVEPNYPVLAVRSGIEGTVTVKVLVSKAGKVRKAIVEAGTAEILNDAAVEAALKWIFTPALMNKGPVAVWVFIPFRFRIASMATSDIHR